MFRVRGDTVEIFPAYATDKAIRVEFFGDEVDRISEVNVVTGAPGTLSEPRCDIPGQPLCRKPR